MALITRGPALPLRTYVRRYFDFVETLPGPARRIEGPGVDVLVVLSFDEDWRIGSATDPAKPLARRQSFVAGLHDHAVITEHDGRAAGMQISFTPAGAYALFGLPMHELARRTISLDDVFGSSDLVAVDRLAEARGPQERFDLLDAALLRRLAAASAPAEGVLWAWRELERSHGRERVSRLASDLGWSRKRLNVRFREQIGLSPKTVSRMMRFEHAAGLIRGGRHDLARIAGESGFYDQPHLTHEFLRVTGTTPAMFARVPNFQDPRVAAS